MRYHEPGSLPDATRAGADLSMAVNHALMIIGFFELPEDEQPPATIWHREEALGEWFEQVDERRKPTSGGDRVETVPMDDNESRPPALVDDLDVEQGVVGLPLSWGRVAVRR